MKEFYPHHILNAITLFNVIKDWLEQPGYKTLQQLQNLPVKAARGDQYTEELGFVIDHYADDFMLSSVTTQLEILTTAFATATEKPMHYVTHFIAYYIST